MVHETAVHDVADRLGIELDGETIEEYTEVANALSEQFGALEPHTPEHEEARAVREGDDEYNALRYRFELPDTDGTLADLSVGVKDNIAVAGVPMHCGSAAVEFTPGYHSAVVERLHEAGAAVTATTNMDEFAYFTTGETCAFDPIQNPRVAECVPGGSSSGSGAAVAAGMLDATLGSDTGGSVRIPASFCGVVGLKPTHRAVPRYGFADLAPSLDCVGPLGPDVETVARVYEAIAGPHPADPSSLASPTPSGVAAGVDTGVDNLHLGVVQPAIEGADDEVAERVQQAIDALTEHGIEAETVAVPEYELTTLAGLVIAGTEFAELALTQGQVIGTGTGYSEPWRKAVSEAMRSADLGENVREQVLTNGALSVEGLTHYVAARNIGTEITGTVDNLLETYDALVTPTTPMTAPEFGEITTNDDFARTVANTVPFNVTGHPALSVPVSGSDAPVGVQFVGQRHDEQTLISLGATLDTVAE